MRLALALIALLAGEEAAPQVFRLDPQTLQQTRRRIREHEASLEPAVERLRADVRKALAAGPFTVTSKSATPPSGDKHDYMSQAPYFWPDPKAPGGLPTCGAMASATPRSGRYRTTTGWAG